MKPEGSMTKGFQVRVGNCEALWEFSDETDRQEDYILLAHYEDICDECRKAVCAALRESVK